MTEQQTGWSIRTADSVIERYPLLSKRWAYENGVVLEGVRAVWEKIKDPKYLNYIKTNIDYFLDDQGNINTYQIEDYNIDQVKSGTLLLFLYQQTGAAKYRKAAQLLRDQLKNHPRTSEGGFWHKRIYPHQMWLDGIYMGEPFYAEFSQRFGEPANFDDIALQIILIAKYTKDSKTGLYYHGWDESKEQRWANKETGTSANFWGRAMGWYAIAIADVLDYFPVDHPKRTEMIGIFQDVMAVTVKYQDPKTGCWYQVLDQGDRAGNYLEASATAMFVYALAKGLRGGYLDPRYREATVKGYRGMVEQFIEVEPNGWVNVNRICSVAGLGQYIPTNPYRDGSFSYYINEPVVPNDYKGVGAFILAAAEMEK